MSAAPRISVVMPTFNGSRFIGEALGSILGQTFRDFEVIVVDDGSTDDTARIVRGFDDSRIILLSNPVNRGLSHATNRAYAAARGLYIAPMDHDDASMPQRLAVQADYLDRHPDVAGCGSGHTIIGRSAWKNLRARLLPQRLTPAPVVAAATLFGGVLFNPTMMFRRNILEHLPVWFDERLAVAADSDFYERAEALGGQWTVLPHALLRYRRHGSNASRKLAMGVDHPRTICARRAVLRLVADATAAELSLHARIVVRDHGLLPADGLAVRAWFRRILAANAASGRFDDDALRAVMARHWQRACALMACHGLREGLLLHRAFDELPLLGVGALLYEWQKRKVKQASASLRRRGDKRGGGPDR